MDGLRLSISEQEFKSMTQADQNWMLYRALTKIDQFGCDWAARKYKEPIWKKLSVLGAGFGAGFGFSIMIGKAFGVW
jgi:hypothetical protein